MSARPVQPSRILMISHCLPDPSGDRQASRTWQLLRMAGAAHQVDLACVTPRQMHLNEWRSASTIAQRLVVDRIMPGPFGLNMRLGNIGRAGSARHLRMLSRSLRTMTRPWSSEHTYDAVLCTHPLLWDAARDIAAADHLCDFSDASDAADASLESLYRQALSQCPSITISRVSTMAWKAGLPAHVTHLPHVVDLASYEDAGADDESPRLALHVDRSAAGGRAMWAWFTRDVWRKVKQAVPETILCNTSREGSRQPGPLCQALRQASVIVTPQLQPCDSQWAVLQSMAMARPVIASSQAVSDLGARHGEHLLLSGKPSHWVEHCVESLRSARIRLQLAKAGRAFVEAHHSLEKRLTQLPLKHSPRVLHATAAQPALRMAA